MNADTRYNFLLAIGIAVGTALLIAFLTTIISSAAGEAAGAFGSVLGGAIGAIGAALAVVLTLSGERTEEKRKEQEREINQINAVIAGIGFDVEMLLHVVIPNFLPHYKDSYRAHRELLATKGDESRMRNFFNSLHSYQGLVMTCPKLHFIEFNFWNELLFIVERDANLLKQSGWLITLSLQLKDLTLQRNKNIDADMLLRNQQGGKLSYYVLDSMLQRHMSVANAECLTALQLFNHHLTMAATLARINDSARGKRLTVPPELNTALSELNKIADERRAEYASLLEIQP